MTILYKKYHNINQGRLKVKYLNFKGFLQFIFWGCFSTNHFVEEYVNFPADIRAGMVVGPEIVIIDAMHLTIFFMYLPMKNHLSRSKKILIKVEDRL